MQLSVSAFILCLVSSVAAQLPTSCSSTIATASPIPKHLHCHSAGKVRAPQTILTTSSKTFEVCRNTCLGNEDCVSFSYDTQSKRCVQYATIVDQMKFVASSVSKTVFSNRHCYVGCPPYTCSKSKCLAAVFRDHSAYAQCSSAFVKTITPGTSTTTTSTTSTKDSTSTTVTTTSTTTFETSTGPGTTITVNGEFFFAEESKATAKPKECANVRQYSNACSCIGVTGTTVTAATPVKTKIKTTLTTDVTVVSSTEVDVVTSTTTIPGTTTTVCASSTPFKIQISSIPQGASNSNPNDYSFNNQYYGVVQSDSPSYDDVSFERPSVSLGSAFYLDDECHLQTMDGNVAALETSFQQDDSGINSVANTIRFATQEYVDSNNLPQMVCQINPDTQAFTCVGVAPSDTVFYTCGLYWRLSSGVDMRGPCEPIDLAAVPVS